MGLLAVVAAAGAKGISRDRAMGLLWAEVGEEQARHALSQAVYALRRGADRNLIVGTTLLRLDPAVASDVAELRTALQAGELETVAHLYTGKFLDGFYLPGAPEFERWVEEERASLEAEVARAFERLAVQMDEEGRRADAVRWWQRLADLDPFSARYAAGLMRALAAAGDRSGALGRAKLYRETVRRELNAEPDSAVEKLEQSLRLAPPVPVSAPKVPEPARVPEQLAASVATPRETEREPLVVRGRPPRWLLPAALLVSVASVGFAVRGLGTRESGSRPFLCQVSPEGDQRFSFDRGPTQPSLAASTMR
jgi:DNA-binding SARP family transcriptional activator